MAEHAVDISPSLVVDCPADISITNGQAEIIKVKASLMSPATIQQSLSVCINSRYYQLIMSGMICECHKMLLYELPACLAPSKSNFIIFIEKMALRFRKACLDALPKPC